MKEIESLLGSIKSGVSCSAFLLLCILIVLLGILDKLK